MPFILDWAAKQITILVWRREEEEQAGSEDESSPKLLNQEEWMRATSLNLYSWGSGWKIGNLKIRT